MRRLPVLASLAFVAGALLYLPSIRHGFVWDDRALIAENRYLADSREIGRNLTGDFFRRSGDPGRIGHWRPLVTATYMLDRRVGGGSPVPFHVTNTLAHGAAAALVVLLAMSLGLSEAAALAAAALFAAHPVHVESVAWISGRTDLLCGVLVLGALVLDARAVRGWPAFVTLLAMMTKEMAVVVPAAVALRALWLPRADERTSNPARSAWRAAWPHLVAIGMYAVVRLGILGIVPRAPEAAQAGRAALFWTWWSACAEYVRVLTWPVDLSIVAPVALETSPLSPEVLIGIALAAAIAALAWRLRRRVPVAAWGLASFLLSLGPLTNFVVPVRAISSVPFPWAERFLFVPTIFLAVAAAALVAALPPARWRLRWAAVAVAAALLSARTITRESVWASQRSLFEAAVLEAPAYAPARVNLAAALLDERDAAGAERELRQALAAAPSDPVGLYLLGNVLREKGDLAGAEEAYRGALAIRPVYPQAMINLGLVAARRGDLDGAESLFRRADEALGGAPETKVNLAIVMRLRGRIPEATALYHQALALDPGFAPAREGLAQLTP